MDELGVELFRDSLRLMSDETVDEHNRVQQMLLGHLAAQGASVEQLALQEVDSRRNVAWLTDFVKLLGLEAYLDDKRHQWTFTTRDAHKARLIQSHVIWRNEAAGGSKRDIAATDKMRGISWPSKEKELTNIRWASLIQSGWRPYVVLGVKRGRKPVWLVGGVGTDGFDDYLQFGGSKIHQETHVRKAFGRLFHMYPAMRSRKRLGNLAAIASSEYPNPEQVEQMFDLDHHVLVVGPQSPGSTRVRASYQPSVKRITNRELAQFEVVSHVQNIAAQFNLTEQLDGLIVAHHKQG